MLFKPGGGRITRMHGAFVSDDDVVSVVSHWKKQLPPSYKVDFVEWATEGTGNVSGSMNGGASENYGTTDDPLYGECVALLLKMARHPSLLSSEGSELVLTKQHVLLNKWSRMVLSDQQMVASHVQCLQKSNQPDRYRTQYESHYHS